MSQFPASLARYSTPLWKNFRTTWIKRHLVLIIFIKPSEKASICSHRIFRMILGVCTKLTYIRLEIKIIFTICIKKLLDDLNTCLRLFLMSLYRAILLLMYQLKQYILHQLTTISSLKMGCQTCEK